MTSIQDILDYLFESGTSMALRVKVTRFEFESAASDGWVDGLLGGRKDLWVYVELGKEQEYIPRPKDDPKTEYKLFIGCDVFYAESKSDLEALKYDAEQYNITVILYC